MLRKTLPQIEEGPAGEMWLLVSELSDRQRQAVALKHVAHLSEAEIAKIMGVKRGTISATLHQAYARLRPMLEENNQSFLKVNQKNLELR